MASQSLKSSLARNEAGKSMGAGGAFGISGMSESIRFPNISFSRRKGPIAEARNDEAARRRPLVTRRSLGFRRSPSAFLLDIRTCSRRSCFEDRITAEGAYVGFQRRVKVLQFHHVAHAYAMPGAGHFVAHVAPLRQVGAVDHAGQTFVVLLHLDAHGAHDLEVVVDLRQRARQRDNTGSHAD